SEEHTSELQSHHDLVCRLLLEKKKYALSIADDWQKKSWSGRVSMEMGPGTHFIYSKSDVTDGQWHQVVSTFVFFFNDTATTEIYTLSLHDALPICCVVPAHIQGTGSIQSTFAHTWADRKSTRLNSSHITISYAVFCLKKKKT